MKPILSRILGATLGAAVAAGNGPWRSRTVWIAVLITALGFGWWLREAAQGNRPAPASSGLSDLPHAAPSGRWDFSRPVPGYVHVSGSYLGGFFLGWWFRRWVRLAFIGAAVAAGLVGAGQHLGWDATGTAEKVQTGAAWVGREAAEARDYLSGMLPSASAAGIGGLLGFRRRGKPAVEPR